MEKLTSEALGRVSLQQYKTMRKRPLYVVLDNVRSLNNVGSVFRSCDAFAVRKLYLCGITARPPHRDIQRTALGATESVEWEYFENTLDAVKALQEQGVEVWAVEQVQGSTWLDAFAPQPEKAYALVFGNEASGLPAEFAQLGQSVVIPHSNRIDSLNLAVAVAIGAYAFTRPV